MTYVTKISEIKANLWKNKRPLLNHLDIELTERCNNDCIHCYINQSADDADCIGRELSFRGIADCLLQAAALGCLTVRFTGGEPLLREDFADIYRFARKLGFRVSLLTNGTLITPELVKLFSEIPPLMPVEITLYGMSPESEARVTRSATSFKAAKRGRLLLAERRVPFLLKWTALPANRDDLDLFEYLAGGGNPDAPPPSVTTVLDLRARRDNPQTNDRIQALRLTPEERLSILTRRPEQFMREKAGCVTGKPPVNGRLFECGAGQGGCIDAYGRFQMCISLRHPDTVYDLSTGSMKDALTRFFPEVRKRTATNPAYLERCARCEIKRLCSQCPAKSWMEHGTLDTPVEYLCECAHAEAKYLGLLQ